MSGKANPTTRRLAASIVKFLQDAQKNGTLDSEDAESMEVAVTIISESFGLDSTPAETANLLQVFDLYEKTREKMVRPKSNEPSLISVAVLRLEEGGGLGTVGSR
jgi:small glutamine-rich tetratricopeptide repeat-containing protein alpha